MCNVPITRCHHMKPVLDMSVFASHMWARVLLWPILGLCLFLGGCYNHVDLSGPVMWEADDRRPIPEPEEETEGRWFIWDGAHKMIFYRVGQFFNLGRSLRTVGTWIGLADPIEAGNVNSLDEVPNSTWYTNRHAASRLSQAELSRGSTTGQSPDSSNEWIVMSAKESLGSTPGFVICDQPKEQCDQTEHWYLIKFDSLSNPEMTTASEMITPRFLHAAGYNVPEHYLVTFDPEKFSVHPTKAKIRGKYRRKRQMTKVDVNTILDRVPHRPDGTIRAVASKFLPGKPKGPFLYERKRPDDSNDRILHENRRELRGLGVVAAFLNHTDTKAANALDMYDVKKRYITHYLIDFSSTLGADNADPQLPRYGNEYFLDFGTVARSMGSLGAYVKAWEVPLHMDYPSVGYFNAEYFDPSRWRPTFPNPAFLHMTARDAYWGAKIVASFTDEDIETIVRTGAFTDIRAEQYVANVLKKRRDKIGKYYFNLINPLDHFMLTQTETRDGQTLSFENLALTHGYAPTTAAEYRYAIRRHVDYGHDPVIVEESYLRSPFIPLKSAFLEERRTGTSNVTMVSGEASIIYATIHTSYDRGENWSTATTVYLKFSPKDQKFKVIGIEREA